MFLLVSTTSAQADEFSGPYAGVEAGYVITNVERDTLIGPFEFNEHAALVSGVVGYRTPLGPDGRVVLGAEGSIGTYTRHANERYSLSGTAGYRIIDKGLLYGRVGYGWLKGVDTNAGEGLDGLILGGGYEQALTDSLSLRAEYRHIDWHGGITFPDNTARFAGHEITAGVLYNF